MNQPICTVPGCDNPTQHSLCHACLTELVTALRELAFSVVEDRRASADRDGHRSPGLAADLADAAMRRTELGAGGIAPVSGNTEAPLPYHAAACALAHRLSTMIGGWARVLHEEHPQLDPQWTTVAAAAEWMAGQPALLRTHPAAAEMHTDITGIVERVRRVVDRAPDRIYAGTCSTPTDIDGETIECPEQLYATPGRKEITCHTCGTHHDVDKRREVLLTAVEDQLSTAAELSRALPWLLATDIPAATIRQWAHTGRLAARPPHAHDTLARPRYRVGDIVDLVIARENERSERDATRPAKAS